MTEAGDDRSNLSDREIAALCDKFQEARSSSGSASIEEFVARCPGSSDRHKLLHALIKRELDLRQSAGEVASVDEFLARFPQD
ncbi:MAG: hypothetical protein ACR2NP_08940, partial [Pirellulaceae bacterium]